jgi:hypothetical protein
MNSWKLIVNIIRMSLLGSALLACEFTSGQELSSDRTELLNLSVRNQDRLLRDLGPALKASGGVGRLYIHSECLGKSEDLFFPRMALRRGTKKKAGLDTLREVFANVNHVTIAERQPGVVGIWVGNVSNDLLQTKIGVLKLKPLERYNELLAIKAILNTGEMESKMRQLRMQPAPMFVIHPIVDPDPKLRHLPALMENLTLDQALDRVAQAFRGLVIYEECTGQNSGRWFSVHMHEM